MAPSNRHTGRPQGGGRDPADLHRLVDEVAEHDAAEQTSTGGPAGPRRKLGGVLVVLILAVVGVAAWNVHIARAGAPPLPEGDQEAALAGMLFVLTRQLDQARRAEGSYPATLDDVAPSLRGVTYRRTQGGYELEATSGGVTVTYRSDQDPQALAALARRRGPVRP